MTQQLVVGEWYELPGIPDVIICLMKTDNFLMYPEWITQRDTLMRSKKKASLDHLRVLFPTHHIVALGELTEDDVWEDGTEYEAGTEWRLDANTRAYLWQSGKTNALPENVLAVKYREPTLVKLRRTYWTFDNPSAAEMAAEVLTGCQKSLGMNLKTKKFVEGQYVTALSYTCQYHDPDNYGAKGLWSETDDKTITQSEYRRTKMQNAIMQYKNTIIALDTLLDTTKYNKHYDQTFMTALFLHHIKNNHFSKEIEILCKLLSGTKEDKYGETEGIMIKQKGMLDAVGWIYRECIGQSNYIPDRGKMDGFAQGVPFFSYWLDVAKDKGLKHQQKVGAKQGYQKWFESFLKRPDFKTLEQLVVDTTNIDY